MVMLQVIAVTFALGQLLLAVLYAGKDDSSILHCWWLLLTGYSSGQTIQPQQGTWPIYVLLFGLMYLLS